MADLKSKHGFGPKANFDAAIAEGKLDSFDIAFFNEGEIGWVNKDGVKVIAYEAKHAEMLETAASDADSKVTAAKEEITADYTDAIEAKVGDIGDAANVAEFVSNVTSAGSEETSNQISQALADSKAYTDEQLGSFLTVVEF